MTSRLLVLLSALLSSISSPGAAPQATSSDGYPAPPADAPTAACSQSDLPASSPVRILAGSGRIPYAFACAQRLRAGACVGGSLDPGLVVAVGPSSGSWSCVTGGDSTAG